MADFSGIFRRPFPEQVAAFRLRLGELKDTRSWDEISRNQHDRAFMVAGATGADLLADLAEAVDKAVAEGTGFDAFKRDFRSIVEKHGWHGWTGEGTAAGEAWRMRTIYRTNMSTTYHAGRYAQLRKAGFKYWIYFHGGSEHPRLHHLSWNGLILPADHPFWDTHFPPNGWGCSCYVIGSHSLKGAIAKGGDPSRTLPDNWRDLDPKTGAPVGIGKLWDYAPGSSAAEDILTLAHKLDALPSEISVDLLQSWVRGSLFERWFADPKADFPLVRVPPDLGHRLGADSRTAFLSPETARKQLARHPELTIMEYAEAQRVVDMATEVIEDRGSLVIVSDQGQGGHVLVVRATLSRGRIYVTSFRRISGDAATRARFLNQLRRRS